MFVCVCVLLQAAAEQSDAEEAMRYAQKQLTQAEELLKITIDAASAADVSAEQQKGAWVCM